MRRLGLLVLAGLVLAACERTDPLAGLDFQRMQQQKKLVPYHESAAGPAGDRMRHPPAGTVAHGAVAGQPLLTAGIEGGRYAERIPLPVTRTFVETGRSRFEIFCATCHGARGDGRSPVARLMPVRRPPSLHAPQIERYPPGRIYEVVTEGLGYMPGYAAQLSLEERWAVVAYVRALQIAEGVALDALPAPIRAEALGALR